MTEVTKQPRRVYYAAGLVLTVGCGSSMSGATPCDADAVQCTPLALSAAAADVAVEHLSALEPTWIKALPVTQSAAEPSGESRFAQLSIGRDGKLWLFDRDEAGLRVSRLDDAGAIVDSTVVSPPAGQKAPLISLAVNAAWDTGGDPSSKLVWTRGEGCDQSVGRTAGCSTEYEKVIFDRGLHGLDEAPLRLPLNESLMSDAFVNDRGDVFYVASTSFNDPPSISKLDRDTREPIWTQSTFDTVSTDYELYAAAVGGGRTAVMRHSAGSYLNGIVFHYLDENGKSEEPAIFTAQVDRSSYRLLSTRRQAVVLYTDDIGDLHVQRMRRNPADAQAVNFLREEYQSLDLRASAISPAGDVYVFTQSGRRDDAQPTLCRAPAEGESSCVTLPEQFRSSRDEFSKLENLVARDGGVVFAQHGLEIVRFDFPD